MRWRCRNKTFINPSFVEMYRVYRTSLPQKHDMYRGPEWFSRYSNWQQFDGPGIESRRGRNSRLSSRPGLGPTQPSIQWVPGLFPGGKAAGAWSPVSIAVIKEIVEIYNSPSEPS